MNVALVYGILLALIPYGYFANIWSQHRGRGDFAQFHIGAQRLVHGEDIYAPIPRAILAEGDTIPEGASPFLHSNLNPPFQTVLIAPLGLLDYRAAYLSWTLMGLLCAIAGAGLLGFTTDRTGHPLRRSLKYILILLLYFPTFISVLLGQWSLLPFFVLVLAWLSWRDGRWALAGGIVGFLASIKLFFGAFFLLMLARREWRAALSFVLVWFACLAISAAVVPLETFGAYLSNLREANWYSASWNGSFAGFFARIFGGFGNVPVLSVPHLASFLSKALSLLALGSLFFLVRTDRSHPGSGLANELSFAVCIPVMLLASPFGWMYYFVFLLISLAVLWRGSEGLARRRVFRAVLLVAWLLSTVPGGLISTAQLTGDPIVALVRAGSYTYALVLFGGLAWGTQRWIARAGAPAEGPSK